MSEKVEIRDAATVIIVRDRETVPRVLMGQRGAKAVFMPSKFVFPGGACDRDDSAVALRPADPSLAKSTEDTTARALPYAAIRELWEETGQLLGVSGTMADDIPESWSAFQAKGLVPNPAALSFIFRAVTPPGRPRRFDARFFLADASALASDPDDFSEASDELSHLQWIALKDVRSFEMPFITEIVLSEVEAMLDGRRRYEGVPFFNHEDGQANFALL
jgi:8-oxo-dGTP pyrophosphatase MutT (NUDIX family)